ncbi:phage tail sheath C-terminal domain-containing protein [uncultured Microscilla sp.]|uniref:phage tail sheath family protein n=1 Tax=uncultured Microscilla sp. TaxID=432653 RepID=UPI002615DDAD|nr:phage tail sheath C-terminal domain-containing protein [uncultured Microscilla sp.]
MAKNVATPGVYIEEKNAFPNSVAAVPTAVPAFVGYTAKTTRNGHSIVNTPVRISSLTEYHNIFGGGFQASFNIVEANPQQFDFEVSGKQYQVVPERDSRFLLYDSIRLFFANGGSTCYIVSAGGYYRDADAKAAPAATKPGDKNAKPGDKKVPEKPQGGSKQVNAISKKALEEALNTLVGEQEPTILVIPEAVMCEASDCYALQQAMLMQCGQKMKNRFAILDVHSGYEKRSYDAKDVITRFREGIGNNNLNFGAAYYPWLYTSIVQKDEISFKNISNADVLEKLLSAEAGEINADSKRAEEAKNEIKKISATDTNEESLNQTLTTISPAFKKVANSVRAQLNILPASAGMAGIYASVDDARGVWKAPANVGYNSVIAPVVKLTNAEQEDLNITATGKSINAIRSFVGEGTVVWGARTLDGNSQDWRYVNVRRTMLYIEESVKNAAKSYVFEPNDNGTWTLIRGMINSFLNDVWRAGGLAGATADQAYNVEVGLGNTMTPQDILDGFMRISVKVAVVRPAEFIVITFQQKMQES